MGPGHQNQPRPTPTQLEGVEGESTRATKALNTSQPTRPYAEVLTILAMVVATIDLYSITS